MRPYRIPATGVRGRLSAICAIAHLGASKWCPFLLGGCRRAIFSPPIRVGKARLRLEPATAAPLSMRNCSARPDRGAIQLVRGTFLFCYPASAVCSARHEDRYAPAYRAARVDIREHKNEGWEIEAHADVSDFLEVWQRGEVRHATGPNAIRSVDAHR